MGKYNSSLYRVRPLMEKIEKDYQSFLKLLKLVGILHLDVPSEIRYDGLHCKEMQLKPTMKHLEALIRYLSKKENIKVSVNGQQRKNLFYGSTEQRECTCEQAIKELKINYDKLTAASKPWYMFEGFTNPDIFIEGEDYVIVCEGKWTEPNITTSTTYLSNDGEFRSQMIRHIQGALNYTNKKVYAFYIVDEECSYTEYLTKESLCKQLEQETIKMDTNEKVAIIDSFYGFTTWQDIKKVIPNVIFKEKHEII